GVGMGATGPRHVPGDRVGEGGGVGAGGRVGGEQTGVIPFRIGTGYDIHRLVEGRPLVLGGVRVPFERGLAGHSDGDALVHAVVDALLGAAALGDIGQHFPPGDPAYRDADSLELLGAAARLVREAGWRPGTGDAPVV